MRRPALLLPLIALCSCAHFDSTKLEAWALSKAQRLAECAARYIATPEDLDRCLGEFAADLGTPACEEAAEVRASVISDPIR